MPTIRRAVPVILTLGLLVARPLRGQTTDSVPTTAAPERAASAPAPVKLWHVGVALGGTALISIIDDDVQHWVMENRTQNAQDIADVVEEWGGFYVPIGVAVGTMGLGAIIQQPEVTRTGVRVAVSVVGAGLVGQLMKVSIGRHRPSEADDQYTFDPFGGYNSFPSGHTLTAFAVSTTLADAIDNPWADVGLYSLAVGTGVSRVIGNHHWVSDVVGGALVGITTAKFVDGRWSLFGLTSPDFLVGPQGAGLKWTVDVPALRGAPRARN
jgi:membrane-associated phospholipid phosphatase